MLMKYKDGIKLNHEEDKDPSSPYVMEMERYSYLPGTVETV